MKKTISQPSLILLVASQLSFGATFTVTNTEDKGPGSLRQAILDANQTEEADSIEFKIPGLEPYTVRPLSPLPSISAPLTIDGTTQPGFAGQPIIELDGTRVTTQAAGLRLGAGNGTIRGLVINRFNTLGSAGLLIASGSSANVIQGNFIGTDVTGKKAQANAYGLNVENGSSDNLFGGTTPGARNVISGNRFNGLTLRGTGHLVQGNFIGTDVTGTIALRNGSHGIAYFGGSWNNTIGGASESARNVISGNGYAGIYMGLDAKGNVIHGNFIGTDLSGRAALGNQLGIYLVRGARDNTIGGPTPGSGNTIAFNRGPGVLMEADVGTGNAIRGNSIFGNTGLGIDFGSGLIKKNDTGDADTGPNNYQNFPVLASAVSTGYDVTFQGTLQSSANAVFDLDFFRNAACSSAGIGQGERFLGTLAVTTDANGDGSFKVTLPKSDAAGQFITATATDAEGNTSPFSQCVQVMGGSPLLRLIVAQPAPGDFVILSWPTSSQGFVLETTDNLSPAAVWLKVPDAPSVAGDENRVTIKTSSRSGFYRLRKP
ncbi:MAG: right-handed parallel beta-helix repeat-containing protein [Verrucomicrobia bacterium]|nr:right-handed parallel beta-helix repeat-containing protein [Verrucomicrobiota bacterium]